MKIYFGSGILVMLFLICCFPACKKAELTRSNANLSPVQPPSPPPPPPSPCNNRPVINATLVPVGHLSSARIYVGCAAAGKKILFIGGWHSGQNWWNEPVPVDIYDISNSTWSIHFLLPENPQFTHFRFGAGIASVENKILIGGGGDGMGDNQTSKVDIYDALTDTWSIQHLSAERQGLTAATVGDKVLFAGGFGYPYGNSTWDCFSTIDIYNNSTNTWSTANLSQARVDLTATTSGNKIYFAGGRNDMHVSRTIDIFDAATNSWSVSALQQPRVGMAGISVDDKIYWSGGAHTLTSSSWWGNNNNDVEILNTSTGASSLACLSARRNLTAVKKDDNIVFFTGDVSDGSNGVDFEIYNISKDTWSTGRLNQKIFNAAVISVNNTIYVAGGTNGTTYSNQVWELKF